MAVLNFEGFPVQGLKTINVGVNKNAPGKLSLSFQLKAGQTKSFREVSVQDFSRALQNNIIPCLGSSANVQLVISLNAARIIYESGVFDSVQSVSFLKVERSCQAGVMLKMSRV